MNKQAESGKRDHRRKTRAGITLIALCLAAAAGLAGCGISRKTDAPPSDSAQPGQEAQEIQKDEKDLAFLQRFYSASPDNMQLLTAEELEDWEASGENEEDLEEGKTGWGIVLADFPREQVTMYGCLDPEKPFQGVIFQCGDSVSYFPEIAYMSDSHQMPDVAPDSSGYMFTVSFHTETGESRSRDLLCVFLKSESGTVTADFFTEKDYLSQMANRFTLSFQKEKEKGTLIRQDGQTLGQADLGWAEDSAVTGLNISDRVHFTPGNPARLEAEIGITAEGKEPYYGDGLAVTAPIEIVVRTYEDGSRGVEFLIGEVERKAEGQKEKSEAQGS